MSANENTCIYVVHLIIYTFSSLKSHFNEILHSTGLDCLSGFVIKRLIVIFLLQRFWLLKLGNIHLHVVGVECHLGNSISNDFVLIDKLGEWNLLQQGFRSKLDSPGNYEDGRSGGNASSPLRFSKSMSSGNTGENLNKEVLSCEYKAEDKDEEWVVVNSLEDIKLSKSNLSAVDVVEYLQVNEGAEDVSE